MASLPELRALCADKIRAAAADGRLLEHDELPVLLYRWVRWTEEDEPKKWAAEVTANAEGAARFVGAFARQTRSLSMGDHVYRANWELKTSEIEDFVDVSSLVEVLSGVDLSAKPEREREGVVLLLDQASAS